MNNGINAKPPASETAHDIPSNEKRQDIGTFLVGDGSLREQLIAEKKDSAQDIQHGHVNEHRADDQHEEFHDLTDSHESASPEKQSFIYKTFQTLTEPITNIFWTTPTSVNNQIAKIQEIADEDSALNQSSTPPEPSIGDHNSSAISKKQIYTEAFSDAIHREYKSNPELRRYLPLINFEYDPSMEDKSIENIRELATLDVTNELERLSDTEIDLTLYEVEEISNNIKIAVDKLNSQLTKLDSQTIKPSEANTRKLNQTTLSVWDHWERYKNRSWGTLTAASTTMGQLSVAAALPTAASFLPFNFGVQATTLTGGAYLALSALKDFPALANDHTALNMVDAFHKTVGPMITRLNELISQEKSRQIITARIGLTSLEREAKVGALNNELTLIGKIIDKQAPPSEHGLSLNLGREEERTQTLSRLEFIKQSFAEVFSSMSAKFDRLFTFLSDIFKETSGDQKTQAADSEERFVTSYKDSLAVLARSRADSAYDLHHHVTTLRKNGIAKENSGEIRLAEKRMFHVGENLLEIIQTSDDDAFGTVVVADDLSADKYPLPASLTLARAMGTYFSLAAPSQVNSSAHGVQLNQDGSLSIDDPGGKIYNFLLAVPSAYTDTMVGSPRSEAHARLTIDDHKNGFPGGASSMQFENALKLDEDGSPLLDRNGNFITELRVRFLRKETQTVLVPLANESKLLNSVFTKSVWEQQEAAELEETGESTADHSNWSRERLVQRRDELLDQLDQELTLLQIDQVRMVRLEFWKHPEAQKFRASL